MPAVGAEIAVPSPEIKHLETTKSERQSNLVDTQRQEYVTPDPSFGLIQYPVACFRTLGPNDEHDVCRLKLLLNHLPELIASFKSAVPPDLVPCGLQTIDERLYRRAILVSVANEDARHRRLFRLHSIRRIIQRHI
jgi:hypothetical protein